MPDGRVSLAALLLAACLAHPTAAQVDTLSHDGLVREYRVHVPPSYDGTATPIVFAFHGGFGSSENIENQSGLSTVADEEGFIVVYPNGTGTIRTWNGGECCGFAANNDVDDVGFVDRLLDRVATTHSVDLSRVYATGISNGGAMTYRLACELTTRITAVAPVAVTYRNDACDPPVPIALLHYHSERDENVPMDGGQGTGPSNVDWLPLDSTLAHFAEYNGCTDFASVQVSDSLNVTTWTGCEAGSAVELYLTSDGGHSWPGGMRTIIGDPVSEAVDASRVMWSFFEQFTRAVPDGISVPATRAVEPGISVFPNPAQQSDRMTAQVRLGETAAVELSVFDLAGRHVRSIDAGIRSAGTHMIEVDVHSLSRGAYVVVLTTSTGARSAALAMFY